ncbi:DUF308 domain-containing protein [Methanobrevibacter millerae]|uniref:Acid-resistance membrane protein n=1 Tax=Methanobrevibacter millerae TaxID=230361 RepID=A0A1G5W3B0_9EURY|nr:DUF308 domain-containing protein [Methanobrevibacter millerae]SDA52589.1 Short repeat of unknown function [Methanobrevibacter millerae]
MDFKKIIGILFVIVGLIFIISPMFSSEMASVIVGLSLLFFGIASIINGISSQYTMPIFSTANIIIGVISLIFGVLFIFFIDALSFLLGLQFYIIGFIMVVFGILGIISESKLSKMSSLLILIIGIMAIALAVCTTAQPVYAAILIGVCLLIEGIRFFIIDD